MGLLLANLDRVDKFWKELPLFIRDSIASHVQTDHYRHARQVLWRLLRYLPYSKAATTKGMVSFVLALNKVNIVAVTTILVLHVGNGRSEHV